jgi:hypothetical protein
MLRPGLVLLLCRRRTRMVRLGRIRVRSCRVWWGTRRGDLRFDANMRAPALVRVCLSGAGREADGGQGCGAALFCPLQDVDHAGDSVVYTSMRLVALVVLNGEAKWMPRNPEQSCRVLACEQGCPVRCCAWAATPDTTTHCLEGAKGACHSCASTAPVPHGRC